MNGPAPPKASPDIVHLRLYTGEHSFTNKAVVLELFDFLDWGKYEIEVVSGRDTSETVIPDENAFPLLVRIRPLPQIRLSIRNMDKEALKNALRSA